MGYKTTTQIILIIISIVIIVTYIKPTYADILKTKNETIAYQDAIEKASEFKNALNSLLKKVNEYSSFERQSLKRYLPDTVDDIAVMRDILTMLDKSRMIKNSITSTPASLVDHVRPGQSEEDKYYIQQTGLEKNSVGINEQKNTDGIDVGDLYATQFEINVTGTYEQFKALLLDFERNAYPLEIVEINFIPGDNGRFYTFNLVLETYSLTGLTK